MRFLHRIASGVVAVSLAGSLPLAQAPEGPPKPGPEHQKLSRFVGKWTGKGDMKPSAFGPSGPMTWTESCEWFSGNFSVVCKSDGNGPMGAVKGLGIISYNPEEKVYTYYGVDSTGWSDLSRGTLDGKVWTFTSTGTMGGKPMHSRFTLTEVSPTKQTFRWEMSEDGKTWNLVMDGESSK